MCKHIAWFSGKSRTPAFAHREKHRQEFDNNVKASPLVTPARRHLFQTPKHLVWTKYFPLRDIRCSKRPAYAISAIGRRNAIRPLRGLHVSFETETASTSMHGNVCSRTARRHFPQELPTLSSRSKRRTRKEDRKHGDPKALRSLPFSRPNAHPDLLPLSLVRCSTRQVGHNFSRGSWFDSGRRLAKKISSRKFFLCRLASVQHQRFEK